jgi:hypothetical protein
MNQITQNTAQDEESLGALAMQFRGTASKTKRKAIAAEYSQIVKKLIQSGNWHEAPALEDQLPDDFMPESFLKYWSVQ